MPRASCRLTRRGKQITRLLGELSGGRKIDYLNAHGAGTVANDQVEARAIQAVFGGRERQPWVNSTKGILGHTLGASGAIEAAVTALSLSRGTVHGNLTEDPMEDLNLPLENVQCPIDNALSVSYGFGGHNGGLLLTRYEPSRLGRERPRFPANMSATEKILVTGATGFIGSHVLEKLSAAGLQVVALARRQSDLAHALSLKVEVRYGDIRDLAGLRQAVRGCTQVIHTAGLACDWGLARGVPSDQRCRHGQCGGSRPA